MRRAFLEVAEERHEIPESARALVVGRSPDCEITVPETSVSRRHARIVVEDESFRIEDLGSSNGTFVGGVRISSPTVLEDGATIRFGKVEATLRIEATPEEPVPAGEEPEDDAPPKEEPPQASDDATAETPPASAGPSQTATVSHTARTEPAAAPSPPPRPPEPRAEAATPPADWPELIAIFVASFVLVAGGGWALMKLLG